MTDSNIISQNANFEGGSPLIQYNKISFDNKNDLIAKYNTAKSNDDLYGSCEFQLDKTNFEKLKTVLKGKLNEQSAAHSDAEQNRLIQISKQINEQFGSIKSNITNGETKIKSNIQKLTELFNETNFKSINVNDHVKKGRELQMILDSAEKNLNDIANDIKGQKKHFDSLNSFAKELKSQKKVTKITSFINDIDLSKEDIKGLLFKRNIKFKYDNLGMHNIIKVNVANKKFTVKGQNNKIYENVKMCEYPIDTTASNSIPNAV